MDSSYDIERDYSNGPNAIQSRANDTMTTYTEGNIVDDDVFGLIALSLIKGIGFHTLVNVAHKKLSFWGLLSASGSEIAATLRSCGARLESNFETSWSINRAKASSATEALLSDFQKASIQVITRQNKYFPRSLLDLPDAPHWLFVQGNVELLSKPSIAVVGTRTPSSDGLWLTKFVGHCLSFWECPTISGLALGIDQGIHQASLDAKLPTTAILGTGIMSNYPKNSEVMRNDILSNNGAIVTEYLPSDSYSAENFVRRNRLQAALSRVLIPVEWKAKSGTAHTVRYAQRLKRPIAAMQIPTWPNDRKPFINESIRAFQAVFNIPGDEEEFRAYIKSALERNVVNVPAVDDLFGGQ